MSTDHTIQTSAAIMKEMAASCVKFKINPSKQSGDLQLSATEILKVDVDQDPDKWKVFDAVSGDMFGQEITTGAAQVIMDRFVNKYKTIVIGKSIDKELERLKLEKLEAEEKKTPKLEKDPEQAKLDAKIENVERPMLEKPDAEEMKMQEMDKREKQRSTMNPVGYTAKVREAEVIETLVPPGIKVPAKKTHTKKAKHNSTAKTEEYPGGFGIELPIAYPPELKGQFMKFMQWKKVNNVLTAESEVLVLDEDEYNFMINIPSAHLGFMISRGKVEIINPATVGIIL